MAVATCSWPGAHLGLADLSRGDPADAHSLSQPATLGTMCGMKAQHQDRPCQRILPSRRQDYRTSDNIQCKAVKDPHNA